MDQRYIWTKDGHIPRDIEENSTWPLERETVEALVEIFGEAAPYLKVT